MSLLMSWILAIAPVLGLSGNVLVQVGTMRWARHPGLLRSVFAGFAAGLALTMLLTILALHERASPPVEWLGQFTANSLTYGALGYGYFHFVNLSQTARRIRLLAEFVDADGPLGTEEVLQRYNAREIVRKRLGRLLGSGQVVLRDGRYVIGKKTVLYMSRALEFMKQFLLGKRSEFD